MWDCGSCISLICDMRSGGGDSGVSRGGEDDVGVDADLVAVMPT